jgi:HD-GYP domain-containing protein (c-di-GMP phosphodiesterase class II)
MSSPGSPSLVPIDAARLRPGMFVAELDRPWPQTTFRGPGLLITHPGQLEEIQQACQYVYIDLARSQISDEDFFASGLTMRLRRLDADAGLAAATGPGANPARAAIRDLAHALSAGLLHARRHESLPLARIREALQPLLLLLRQDPDTVAWIIATELKAGLIYRRALDSAVNMVRLARRLGFDDSTTAELALGALVLDVGKITIPMPILTRQGPLSADERSFVHRHVRRGLHLLRNGTLLSEPVQELCLGHHERLDGSGYPRGLRGTRIPLQARMAAIVDTYGALIHERHYARACARHEALRRLHARRRVHFDAAMLREFVHAVGVYPTGSAVELADGRRGIVRQQQPGEPRAPLVWLLTDRDGHSLGVGEPWTPRGKHDIARALPPAGPAGRPC